MNNPATTPVPQWFSYYCAGFPFGCAEDVTQFCDECLVLAKVTQRIDEHGIAITELDPQEVPNKLYII